MMDSIALTLREHRLLHPDSIDVLDEIAVDLAELAEDKNEFLVTCDHPDGNAFQRATPVPKNEQSVIDNLARAIAAHRADSPKVVDELSEKIARSLAKVTDNLDQALFLRNAGHPPVRKK